MTLDFAEVLARAAGMNDRPASPDVITALLQAEKTTKKQRINFPESALIGSWRLRFATGTRRAKGRSGIVLGTGFYWPQWVPAGVAFEATDRGLGIRNRVQVGVVQIDLTGPARYLGKKNLLAFDFVQMQVKILDRVVYSGAFPGRKRTRDFERYPIADLPFFAFFSASDRYLAARGRGGGLALWVKE